NVLRRKQIGETVRELGLAGQSEKSGTPTMGGLIIIFSTLIPVLLFARLDNIYVILLIISTLWMGAIGFVDDYIKIFKKDKAGLHGKFKVLGQVGLGIIVGTTLFFHPEVTIKEEVKRDSPQELIESVTGTTEFKEEEKSAKTTIPFVKENEFDYSTLISWTGENYKDYAWIIFIPFVIII